MDYAIIALAAASGLTVGGAVTGLLNRKLRQAQADLIDEYHTLLKQVEDTRDKAVDHLQALRRNCFITNEKGHRVRYFNASPEKRAAAEGN